MISFRAVKLYLYLLVFLVTLATFIPVTLNDFVNWDDHLFVVDNAEIGTLSWRSLLWMMTSFYQGVWHPLPGSPMRWIGRSGALTRRIIT